MNYLRCNYCGYLNEVKTEYQTFCTNCNKKLDNNFSSWHQNHPDKDFSEFIKSNCVTDEELSIDKRTKSKHKRGLTYWIGFIIVFGIFYLIGNYSGVSVSGLFSSDKTPKKVLTQEWVHGSYGEPSLIVDTPEKLTKSKLPLPENIKQLIKRMDSYNSTSKNGFSISINCITYIPDVGTLSLQGAADGSIKEIRSKVGVTDFAYTEKEINYGDIPGFLQNVTCKMDGKDCEFINVGYSSGLSIWQVIVGFLSDDEVGRSAALRVIKSIEIKK